MKCTVNTRQSANHPGLKLMFISFYKRSKTPTLLQMFKEGKIQIIMFYFKH